MLSLTRQPIDDPAEGAARLLSRLGVFLLFVAAQLAPILALRTVYILLPIGAALLLLGASLTPGERRDHSLWEFAGSPVAVSALFLVLWAGLSLAWTPFGSGPAERFAKSAGTLALVAVVCFALPRRTKTSNLNLLPIGAGVAALTLIVIASQTHASKTVEDILDVGVLARVGLGLALLVWPAMGALAVRDRWPWAGALGLATVAACYICAAPNALPALAVGALVFAGSFGRSRTAAAVLAVVCVAIIALAPILALVVHFLIDGRGPGFLRPLDVWGRMVASDGVRALVGHGYGAAIFGFFGGYLDLNSPRSFVFQLWFDLGAIGVAAFALVVAGSFRLAGMMRPALAPFLLAGLATGLTICVMGPAAEQLWWFTLAGLDAIAYALVVKGQFRKRRPRVPLNVGGAPDAA